MTCDGYRNFAHDDENELIGVWMANAWSNSFAYDSKMRCRIERDYGWQGGRVETNEVHFIYDGNVVIEERNANNVPPLSDTRDVTTLLQLAAWMSAVSDPGLNVPDVFGIGGSIILLGPNSFEFANNYPINHIDAHGDVALIGATCGVAVVGVIVVVVVDDGQENRQRYDWRGNPLDPSQAHDPDAVQPPGNSPCPN